MLASTSCSRQADAMTSGDPGSAQAALREMRDGIAFWRSRKWPTDFHNACYQLWATQNRNGEFTAEWWENYQLPRLTSWVATRPVGRKVLTARFIESIAALRTAWQEACLPSLVADIAEVTWDEVKAFPDEVAKIKPTKTGSPSAVFTSKFCHFLLPRVFPVLDNAGLGSARRTYESFRSVQNEWVSTGAVTRDALSAELTDLIEAEGRPIPDSPSPTRSWSCASSASTTLARPPEQHGEASAWV